MLNQDCLNKELEPSGEFNYNPTIIRNCGEGSRSDIRLLDVFAMMTIARGRTTNPEVAYEEGKQFLEARARAYGIIME